MLKFIWGRGQGPTVERVKLQKELFNFSKNIAYYGFSSKPTACYMYGLGSRASASGHWDYGWASESVQPARPGVEEIIGDSNKEEVGVVEMKKTKVDVC